MLLNLNILIKYIKIFKKTNYKKNIILNIIKIILIIFFETFKINKKIFKKKSYFLLLYI